MTWFSDCKAPDLSDLLIPVVANYVVNFTFRNRGGHDDPQVRSFLHAYILATDKAIRSYQRGRALFAEYAKSENRFLLLFEGLGEFETCVSTSRRSLRLAAHMASHSENPEIDRTKRRLLENYEQRIRPVRDAIEHMDEDIAGGRIAPGDPSVLSVSRDGLRLEIGAHVVSFDALAGLLRNLHALSLALAERERT